MTRLRIGVCLFLLSTTGCTSVPATPPVSGSTVITGPATTVRPGPPGSCHATAETGGTITAADVLPDRQCTPGALNPNVTQADIASTICKTGWTATIRPPSSYTSHLKSVQVRQYGFYGGQSLRGYEEDHLVSLELGGSPTSPLNLWPELHGSPNPKDTVENEARRAVCSGRLTLAAVQQQITADWVALGRQLAAAP